ncbi:DUF2953 domain-containing protein [Sporosalibacterium faouarense]|uniref:DUF2953 domain-containing protein n=1 Tax=Sporosalibacterium faouarense TaxID=516123 RepID=UPI00141C66FE|nr:DUF2953 domain-containing protein [Sporosalibacterium faouarense]MTI48165.1 DUF2953 domain-containing protein [Bacillota bacterium]
MIYAIVAIILILFLIFIPFYINIELLRKNNNDYLKFKFIIIKGLIKFDLEIPFIDIIKNNNKFSLEIQDKIEKGKKEKDVSKKKKVIPIDKILKKIKETLAYDEMIKTISKYMLKKIKINEVNWETKIGFHDSSVTAVLTGFVWSIKNIILSFLVSTYDKKIEKMHLNVLPAFNENIFETHLNCIIKLKMAYIIIAGLKGLKVKIRGGVKNE